MKYEKMTNEQINELINLHSKFESTLLLFKENLQKLFENRMLYDSTIKSIEAMEDKYTAGIPLKVSEMKKDKNSSKQLQKTLSTSISGLLNNFSDISSLKTKIQSLNIKLNETYSTIIMEELNKK